MEMEPYSTLHFQRGSRGILSKPRMKRSTRESKKTQGPVDIPTIKLVQQGVGVQQGTVTNREIFGCYNRPSDFTITCIGYMIGIHNFFRFPHLCYKFGGGFIIAFIIMLIIIGAPVIFLEFTIGQYYSVGVREAFSEIAPVLAGTSLILTWNSLITCIMYTAISTWIRVYSGVSTSCLRPWENCDFKHYYNTDYCYTGSHDDDCNDLKRHQYLPTTITNPSTVPGENEKVFFNYQCISLLKFCEIHGWVLNSVSDKTCYDPVEKISHSIYERRIHAASEYFYGAVCGMERVMEELKRNLTEQMPSGLTEKEVREALATPAYTKQYWTKEMQRLQPDNESASGHDLKVFAITTWIIFGVLLFEGLLSMSVFTYIINGIPFIILFYMTITAIYFENSFTGVQALLNGKELLHSIGNLEMWAEAVIQVIITTGIGNGVLISLSTFNRMHHGFLFDTFFTILLNIITSACATLIAFCTIGHVLIEYRIEVNFFDFIKTESTTTSIEFGYIIYTHFLTIIYERHSLILLFFFMTTSFTTDSCLRMIQNLVDTLISIFPRLRQHSTVAMVGICFIGLLLGFPMTKSGGIIFYIGYEYSLIQFVFPAILFMEVAGICWIYKAGRILDNAELMEVIHNRFLIWYFWLCLQILIPMIVAATLIFNIYNYKQIHFNTRVNRVTNMHHLQRFALVFVAIPSLLWILGIVDEVMQLDDLSDWRTIFLSHEDKHLHEHHHLLNEDHQLNQMDFIVNHQALIDMEEKKHMKNMEQAMNEKKSKTGKQTAKEEVTNDTNKGSKAEVPKRARKRDKKPEVKVKAEVVKEAKELNKEILGRIIFKRDWLTKNLKIKKYVVEKLLFCRDTKGNLKFRKDVLRKILFRRSENGRLKISKKHLGNVILGTEEGHVCIHKNVLQALLTQSNDSGRLRLNKHLLSSYNKKKSNVTEDKIRNIIGLVFTFPGAQGKSRIRAAILKLLIQRKNQHGALCVPKKLLSKILLGRKYYTGHTFVKKSIIRTLLCRKTERGEITLKRNQLGKLLFYKNPNGFKLSNYFIRTVILKEDQHSGNAMANRNINRIRRFLVKAGADVKLWSCSPLFKKIRKAPNGKFILGKQLVEKVRLRKLFGKRYVISRHLLKKIKRKGNLNIGKHTTTKLKLAKYPFEKFSAFSDAFGRLKRDNTGGLKLRKMIAVLKSLQRHYRKDHRHSSFMRDHTLVADHRTKMDIWVEKILKHFEEWPGRLDDHIFNSESSEDSEDSSDYRRIHKTRVNHMGRKELLNELKMIS